MNDYVTLLGSEQVQKAGYAMREAAEQMQRAASLIDESLRLQRQWMDDWLLRFSRALEAREGNAT